MKSIAFLSTLDSNLYLFRLPIMKELVKQGYAVYAICPSGQYETVFAQEGITSLHYPLSRKSLNPLKELNSIWCIYQLCKTYEFDIVNSFMLKPNIYASFCMPFLKKTKLICAVTGVGSFYIDDSFKSLVLKKISQWLYKFSFFVSEGVVFQNKDDLRLFVDAKIISKQKSTLIKSSGIDTQSFTQATIDKEKSTLLKESLQIKNKQTIILLVARLIIHKGIREYIKSATSLKDKHPQARFFLVGGRDKGNHFSIDETLLDNPNIEHLGEREDIKELIDLCHFFVLPSYREGVPRTLLEAASMGKAIVTTNVPGCKEAVKHNYNGYLVKARDSLALTKAIEALIVDKKLQTTMGANSRQWVQQFDIHPIVKKYISLYEKVMKRKRKNFYLPCKYFLDKVLALVLLLVLSPALLIVSVLIYFKMGKPILFTQKRIGLKDEAFDIYKFRTMSDEVGEDGKLLEDKYRLKGIGKIIRSASLDELPQIFNILKGQMSFIGPRPLLPEYLPLYNKEQKKRHLLKPGITGLAQVNGRNAISWEEKFSYDVEYVHKVSFWLDMQIFLKTIAKIVSKEGISSQTNATMERFQGTKTKKTSNSLGQKPNK